MCVLKKKQFTIWKALYLPVSQKTYRKMKAIFVSVSKRARGSKFCAKDRSPCVFRFLSCRFGDNHAKVFRKALLS